eukprot:364782-Chlamydomonas_euryale.AAC.15
MPGWPPGLAGRPRLHARCHARPAWSAYGRQSRPAPSPTRRPSAAARPPRHRGAPPSRPLPARPPPRPWTHAARPAPPGAGPITDQAAAAAQIAPCHLAVAHPFAA